jgi:hypothetical protein
MKNIKSGTRTCLTDEHLEETSQIATTSIKPDIEALIKISSAKFPTKDNVNILTSFLFYS